VATSQPGSTGSYCPGTTAHRSEQIKHGSRANGADQQGELILIGRREKQGSQRELMS